MSDNIDISEALQKERKLLERYREFAALVSMSAPDSAYRNEVVERLKKIDAAIASIDEALKGMS